MLKRGSRGNGVRVLQARLNILAYRDDGGAFLAEDGSFGPRTEQAVNNFKDAVHPGGNVGEWRGVVGETTQKALASAQPRYPQSDARFWIPPFEYNDGGRPWSEADIHNFIEMDTRTGNRAEDEARRLTWAGCTERLMEARTLFELECANRNWRIRYTSAYRPLIYQAHFFDVVNGIAGRLAIGRTHARSHGLGSVSRPNRNSSTHIMGIAFDAQITDERGNSLNPTNGTQTAALVHVAAASGLVTPRTSDRVHFELARR